MTLDKGHQAALEAFAPAKQHKHYTLTGRARTFLARRSRRALKAIFRFSRDQSRAKGAYFWRQVKMETWKLLAGDPDPAKRRG